MQAAAASELYPSAASLITAAVSLVGIVFAYYKFRFVPRERKLETLEAMQKQFKRSSEARGQVLPSLPHFMLDARNRLHQLLESFPDPEDHTALKDQLMTWTDPTGTAAHEILNSEIKFRCLLLSIETVTPLIDAANEARRMGFEQERDRVLLSAVGLVHQLNDFAQLVELDLFTEDDVFGHFHRAIAPACKAVEPIIWARNANGGRWGLRVLRLQLRTEHFNQIKKIHRSSDLAWVGADGCPRTLIQRALYYDDYGQHAPVRELRAAVRARLAWDTSITRIRKRYGGARLRHHLLAEQHLLGRLRFATEAKPAANEGEPSPGPRLEALDLNWRMDQLDHMIEAARRERREAREQAHRRTGNQVEASATAPN